MAKKARTADDGGYRVALADSGTGLRKVRTLLDECAEKIGDNDKGSAIVADALNDAARGMVEGGRPKAR